MTFSIRGLAQFEADLAAFSQTLMPQASLDFQQKIILDLLTGMVMRTPVDTGRARGGWQVTVATPATSERKQSDRGGSSTINDGTVAMSAMQPYGIAYINNNVFYLPFLEGGHSPQARPAGSIIAITIAEMQTIFP